MQHKQTKEEGRTSLVLSWWFARLALRWNLMPENLCRF